MATAFTRALARLHANPDLAVAALFRRSDSSTWISLRVIRTEPSNLPGARTSGYIVQINVADLDAPPKRNDFVKIDGITRKIDEVDPDMLRLAYTCALSATIVAGHFAIGVSAVGGPDAIP